MKKEEFMTLATFSSLESAQVVKGLLDSMGVESQIIHDMATSVMPYLETDGSIRIIVNADDYPEAKKILDADFDKAELKAAKK